MSSMSLSFDPTPATPPTLQRFLEQLFEDGQVEVPMQFPEEAALNAEDEQVEAVLAARAEAIAATLAPPVPTPDLPTALWAAKRFYFAAFAYVHREISADDLRAGLSKTPPASSGGDADFGADLVFAFAPDLVKMARATASADPLVEAITSLLQPWPLSSVGMESATPPGDKSLALWRSDSLRALYVDRVIEMADLSRLNHTAVREAVSAAIGAHPELSPELARAIDEARTDAEDRADVGAN